MHFDFVDDECSSTQTDRWQWEKIKCPYVLTQRQQAAHTRQFTHASTWNDRKIFTSEFFSPSQIVRQTKANHKQKCNRCTLLTISRRPGEEITNFTRVLKSFSAKKKKRLHDTKLNVIRCECVARSFYSDGDCGFALHFVMSENVTVCVCVCIAWFEIFESTSLGCVRDVCDFGDQFAWALSLFGRMLIFWHWPASSPDLNPL